MVCPVHTPSGANNEKVLLHKDDVKTFKKVDDLHGTLFYFVGDGR